MDQRPPSLQEIAPILRRAISASKRRKRQVWLVWTGRRIVLRTTYRRRRGLLIARVIGEEIFPSDIQTYEGKQV